MFDADVGVGVVARIDGVDVPGSFQHEFVLIDQVENQMPVFRVFASAAAGLSNGTELIVSGGTYCIKSIQPGRDGVFTKLVLEDAA